MQTAAGKAKKRARRLILILAISLAVAALGIGIIAYLILTGPEFNMRASLKAGDRYMADGEYSKALAEYREGQSLVPTDQRPYEGIINACLTLGDLSYEKEYETAEVYYNDALEAAEFGAMAAGSPTLSQRAGEIREKMDNLHKHDSGTYTDIKTPSCTEEGIREWRCNTCGEVIYTMSIQKLPHTPGDWEEKTAPTCTSEGEIIKKCTVCGEVLESESIPMIAHEPGEWETAREADCLDGLKVRKCIRCGEVVEQEVIPAKLKHTSGKWETIKEPDCEHDGEKAVKCTRCGTVLESEVIPAKGHTRATKSEKYEDTDVVIYRCTECGKILEPVDLARFLNMESLPLTLTENSFHDVIAEYDEKGKLVVSFSLYGEMLIDDYGYLIFNNSDLPDGFVVTYDQSRSKLMSTSCDPRSLNEPVEKVSITDTKDEIAKQLQPSTIYYFKVFYIYNGRIIISDFHSFETK